ncbi:MAG: hypothetical protein EBZ69_04465, partial [Alphaproteobacteria bacterium]|nr:hypothetical protein [Alphaproteobacteria bacterium]
MGLVSAAPVFAQVMGGMPMGAPGGPPQPPVSMIGPSPEFLEQSTAFAFVGTECPKHSVRFKGPENADVSADGIVYCVFARRYNPVPKTMFNGKCPGDVKPYESATFKSDASI